jgi:hypothetical protein
MQLQSSNGGADPGIDLVFQGEALVVLVILTRSGRRSLDQSGRRIHHRVTESTEKCKDQRRINQTNHCVILGKLVLGIFFVFSVTLW